MKITPSLKSCLFIYTFSPVKRGHRLTLLNFKHHIPCGCHAFFMTSTQTISNTGIGLAWDSF